MIVSRPKFSKLQPWKADNEILENIMYRRSRAFCTVLHRTSVRNNVVSAQLTDISIVLGMRMNHGIVILSLLSLLPVSLPYTAITPL